MLKINNKKIITMGVILNFGKWRKLHEAEEAEMATDASASGPNPYSPNLSPEKIQSTLIGISKASGYDPEVKSKKFWQLSNAVGGILKKLGPLNLSQAQRTAIAIAVDSCLDNAKYPKTINMFNEWSKSTGWESFLKIFSDEPGKAEGITDDWDNKLTMPRDTGAKWNMD